MDIQNQDDTNNRVPSEAGDEEKLALKKRVGELEEKIAALEAETARKRISWKDAGKLLPGLGLLILVIILAAIPSLLVMKDRWLENPYQSAFLDKWWYDLGFAEAVSFRPYFLIIILCIFAAVCLVLLARSSLKVYLSDESILINPKQHAVDPKQRRIGVYLLVAGLVLLITLLFLTAFGSHQPGWDLVFALGLFILGMFLYDNALISTISYIKFHGVGIFAMILSTLSIILFFESYYSKDGVWWGFIVLLALALIYLFHARKQIPVAFWIFLSSLTLLTLYINAWWFSVIGDDYSFFNYALELATRHPFGSIGDKLFNGQGVYGAHPQFSSIIQAIFIKLFGGGNFGWRISNIFLSAMAIGFFYSFFKVFVDNRLAIITAILLVSSEYLMTFGKIGYNNLQSFFVLGLILWAASYAIRQKTLWSYTVLGLSIGLCFFVYPASLYTSILPLILLAIYDWPLNKNTVLRWGVLVVSIIAVVFPLFFQPEYWGIKEAGTFFYNPEITKSAQSIFGHLGRNLLYALLSFLYIHEESHFIAVSYLDPISGILLIIGLVYVIKLWRVSRFSKFWIGSFALMLFLVGASHDRLFPPSTRMFLLLPWFALFAASGLAWIHHQASRLTRSTKIDAIFPVVLFLIIVINIYQAYTLSPARLGQYQGIEALFLRIARQGEKIEPQLTKHYVFMTQPNWGVDGLLMIQKVYDTPASPLQIERVVITDDDLAKGEGAESPKSIIPEGGQLILANRNAVVFLQRFANEGWTTKVESALTELGMVYCEANNFKGGFVLRIWHYGLYNGICE